MRGGLFLSLLSAHSIELGGISIFFSGRTIPGSSDGCLQTSRRNRKEANQTFSSSNRNQNIISKNTCVSIWVDFLTRLSVLADFVAGSSLGSTRFFLHLVLTSSHYIQQHRRIRFFQGAPNVPFAFFCGSYSVAGMSNFPLVDDRNLAHCRVTIISWSSLVSYPPWLPQSLSEGCVMS